MSKLDAVPDVDIDVGGRFKYILIKISDGTKSKNIVRGYKSGAYHAYIYDMVEEKLTPMKITSECVGGGRIEHDPTIGKIFVYGYSQGYGRADHATSVEILKKAYDDYDHISWSNEGY